MEAIAKEAVAKAVETEERGEDEDGAERVVLERRLSASQIARRVRLCSAARELASEGGYAAVTMRDVAVRAGVGLATVYRYFSSKDHLIAEVNGERSQQLISALRAQPPRGATPARRVAAVFDQMLDATAEDLNVAAAGVAAMTSADPAASSKEYWSGGVVSPLLDMALGDASVGDRDSLGQILGHLFFSLMIGLTTRRMPLDEAKAIMREAIERIVPEA